MQRFFRRVIKVTAWHSPNVRLAEAEIAAGREPSGTILVPGVVTWEQLQHRLKHWDKIRQKVGLRAEFPEDESILLFPPEWLKRAVELAKERQGRVRKAKSIGIDPAEGGDKTAMCAVDELGLVECVSRKTPQTADVTGEAIAFGRKHGVPARMWFFDRGGGGTQHADRLRRQGFECNTVGFGESVKQEVRKAQRMLSGYNERLELREEGYAAVDRRSQMYWMLRECLDPSVSPLGFAISEAYAGDWQMGEIDLFNQMAAIPLTYDENGRFDLLPKHKPDQKKEIGEEETDADKTLVGLIGHSPDELDALALAVYGMKRKTHRATAGLV